METAEQIKEQIETLKKHRAEIEAALVKARQDVAMWLENVSRACQREIYQIEDNGDLAEGEIESPWNLLQASIAQLRKYQDMLRFNTDSTASWESELADLELGTF